MSWVCCAETVKGSVGENVDIRCQYPTHVEYSMVYLMKKINMNTETVMVARKKDGCFTQGRYSLCQDSENRTSVFTIDDVRKEDAGIYRCGADSIYEDYHDDDGFYIEVHLEVEQGRLLPIHTISEAYVAF